MRTFRLMLIAAALACATSVMASDIAPGGTLRAIYLGSNPAQAMRDPATGEVRGPAYDLARELARRNNVPLEFKPIASPPAVIEAVKNADAARAEAVIVLPDLMFEQHIGRIVEFAAMQRLPAMYYARSYVEAGGLMSYAPSYRQMFRRAAAYVDKILRGEKSGELPVEQPVAFDLVLNMKTARALGLEVPPGILIRASELIE